MVLLAVLAVVVLGAMFLSRPGAAVPTIALPKAPPPERVVQARGIAGMEVDVSGALGHAAQRHGSVALDILRAAQAGRCTKVYIECGANLQAPEDGTKGYMVCPLSDGGFGLVPFYVDALVGRIVAMTAFVIRPGYEKYVAQRDGCVPIESLLLLLEENDVK